MLILLYRMTAEITGCYGQAMAALREARSGLISVEQCCNFRGKCHTALRQTK